MNRVSSLYYREQIGADEQRDKNINTIYVWLMGTTCMFAGAFFSLYQWWFEQTQQSMNLLILLVSMGCMMIACLVFFVRGYRVVSVLCTFMVLQLGFVTEAVIVPDEHANVLLMQIVTFGYILTVIPIYWQKWLSAITLVTIAANAIVFYIYANNYLAHPLYVKVFSTIGTIAAGSMSVWIFLRLETRRDAAQFALHQSIVLLEDKVTLRTQELRTERDHAAQDAKYLELLNQISVGMLNQRKQSDLLLTLLQGACQLLGVEDGEIRTLGVNKIDGTPIMVPVCAIGRFAGRSLSTGRGEGLIGRTWDEGRLHYVSDYRKWPHRLSKDENSWLRAVVCTPMIVNGEVIGTLIVTRSDETTFTPDNISYLERLAQLGSLILQNMTALEVAHRELNERKIAEGVLQRNASYLAALNDTTLEMIRSHNLDHVFEDILTRACALVHAAGGYIMIVNPAGNMLETKLTHGLEALKALRQRAKGEDIGGMVWQAGKSLRVNDYRTWPHRLLDQVAPDLITCVICMPLLVNNEVAGVISVMRTEQGAGFSDDDQMILERFARLAAVAYVNAKLYQDVQRQRDFAAAILSNMNQAVVVFNTKGKFEYANPANQNIIGYSAEELTEKRIIDLIDPVDLPKFLKEAERFRRPKPTTGDYGFIHKNGRRVRLRVSNVPRIENGVITGSISVAEDVTAEVEMQNNLRLAHDRVLETSRLKSRFMATMSHEIRTPMNAILGLTELALDDPALTPELRDLLGTVYESSQSLHTLITEMLDFSKIEAGKLDLYLESVNIATHAAKIMAMFETRARSHGVNMFMTVAPDVPEHVRADATRLRQVLTNLLGNAEKFTSHGSITLNIFRINSVGLAQGALLFEVTDTGIGMSSEVQKNLFQPFQQGDSSTTRVYGGTGLGLVICKSLVELMGGEIGVRSKEGDGSTFSFTLPIQT